MITGGHGFLDNVAWTAALLGREGPFKRHNYQMWPNMKAVIPTPINGGASEGRGGIELANQQCIDQFISMSRGLDEFTAGVLLAGLV